MAVVDDLRCLVLAFCGFTLRVVGGVSFLGCLPFLLLVEDDQNFAEDQGARYRREIVQQDLVEVVQVPLLGEAHLRVGQVLGQILDKGQGLGGAIDEQSAVHQGDKARQDQTRVRTVQVRLVDQNDVVLLAA